MPSSVRRCRSPSGSAHLRGTVHRADTSTQDHGRATRVTNQEVAVALLRGSHPFHRPTIGGISRLPSSRVVVGPMCQGLPHLVGRATTTAFTGFRHPLCRASWIRVIWIPRESTDPSGAPALHGSNDLDLSLRCLGPSLRSVEVQCERHATNTELLREHARCSLSGWRTSLRLVSM